MNRKRKNKGFATIQVAILFPLLIAFIALCYDYMIYLDFKMALIRGIEEFKLELNTALNTLATERIRAHESFFPLDEKSRSEKSLFDTWHFKIENSHLESMLKRMLADRLRIRMDDVEELSVKFESGFLKNRYTIRYRIRANGIFKFVKDFGSFVNPDFRVMEGQLSVHQQNTYLDIIHLDMMAKKIQDWDQFNEFADKFKSKLEMVKNAI